MHDPPAQEKRLACGVRPGWSSSFGDSGCHRADDTAAPPARTQIAAAFTLAYAPSEIAVSSEPASLAPTEIAAARACSKTTCYQYRAFARRH
jgi:hypothetical protein